MDSSLLLHKNEMAREVMVGSIGSKKRDGELYQSVDCITEYSDSTHSLSTAKHEPKYTLSITVIVFLFTVITVAIVSIVYHNRNKVIVPLDLAEICSDANVSTKSRRKKCEDACQVAKCCLSDGKDNCIMEKEELCGHYYPCGSLSSEIEEDADIQSSNIPLVVPAPNNIGSLCSDAMITTPDGFAACQSTCNAGVCCFVPAPIQSEEISGSSTLSIVHPCQGPKYLDICDTYAPCKSLLGVKTLTALVDTMCASENVQYIEGRKNCEKICKERSCCFTESQKENCRSDNESWCNEFKSCEILSNIRGKLDHEHILHIEICHDISKLSQIDVDSCKAYCDAAKCCYNNDKQCDLDCAQYQYCNDLAMHVSPLLVSSLENDDDDPLDFLLPQSDGYELYPGPPSNRVYEICSNDENLHECYFLCSPYLCCFYDTYHPLVCHAEEVCAKYSHCSKLFNASTLSEPLLTKISSDDGIFPADEICSIDFLSDYGVSSCQSMCEKYMCCFTTKNSCTANEDCPTYQACAILIDEQFLVSKNNGVLNFNFHSICSVDSLGTVGGHRACESICKPFECCGTGECPSIEFCHNYDACKNLHGQMPNYTEENDYQALHPSSPLVELDEFCSLEKITSKNDLFAETICLKLCTVAECCRDKTCVEELRYEANNTFFLSVEVLI